MTEKDRTIIADFENRLHRLVYEYKQKKELNRELAFRIQEKKNALKELQLRCASLEKNYNDLKQARIISLGDTAIDETKERITKLVREIDRCIESLTRTE
jgi:chromosome segregation ATPase